MSQQLRYIHDNDGRPFMCVARVSPSSQHIHCSPLRVQCQRDRTYTPQAHTASQRFSVQSQICSITSEEEEKYIYKLRTKCNGENITSWWLCKTISFNKNLNNVLFYTFPVSRKRICAASFVVERPVYAYCGMSEWVAPNRGRIATCHIIHSFVVLYKKR